MENGPGFSGFCCGKVKESGCISGCAWIATASVGLHNDRECSQTRTKGVLPASSVVPRKERNPPRTPSRSEALGAEKRARARPLGGIPPPEKGAPAKQTCFVGKRRSPAAPEPTSIALTGFFCIHRDSYSSHMFKTDCTKESACYGAPSFVQSAQFQMPMSKITYFSGYKSGFHVTRIFVMMGSSKRKEQRYGDTTVRF